MPSAPEITALCSAQSSVRKASVAYIILHPGEITSGLILAFLTFQSFYPM